MQATAERLLAHLKWAQQYTTELIDEITPIAYPKVLASDVGLDWEILDGERWRSIVTRHVGPKLISFVCVGGSFYAVPDDLIVARPTR